MTTAAKDLEVGYELPPQSKLITQEMMSKHQERMHAFFDRESDGNEPSIHTDLDVAQAEGIPGTIVDALIYTAWLSSRLTEVLGEGYVKGGTLTLKFIKPVLANDVLTQRIVVGEKRAENGAIRMIMDVWYENQRKEKVTVGTASGIAR